MQNRFNGTWASELGSGNNISIFSIEFDEYIYIYEYQISMVSTINFPFSQSIVISAGPAAGSGPVRLKPTGLNLKADDLFLTALRMTGVESRGQDPQPHSGKSLI